MLNQKIQNYKIISLLGEGGMANVYLAENELLGSKVAFKLLKEEFVQHPNIRKRFLAEARNLAQMSHPNIIKVTDLIDAGDIVAFVMEYIEGDTLEHYIEHNGKLPNEEIESFLTTNSILRHVNLDETILVALKNLKETCNDTEWRSCLGNCFILVNKYIQEEIHSTHYILSCIADSVLWADTVREEERKIHFMKNPFNLKALTSGNPSEYLTGNWENDSQYISLILPSEGASRLIMGFGPSASGKTHWAQTLITLFSQTQPFFPKVFLSIDGGIYRSTSIVYKSILKAVGECFAGVENLVSAGFSPLSSSLFNSDIIKDVIINYLKTQKIPISLYVPETLSGCFLDCSNKVKKYIQITKDEKGWIGVYIWQHLRNCPDNDDMKCVGCETSGKHRETTEGKKYSSKAYDISCRNGLSMVEKAPGGIFKIHNSGKKGKKSTVEYTAPWAQKN